MTAQSEALPPPIQSTHEPELWHFWLQYSCGHTFHASGKFPTSQNIDQACPGCLNPIQPEFVERSKWVREQRLATWKPFSETGQRPQGETLKSLALKLGVSVSDISAMELGKRDPEPLEIYWKGLAA